MKRNKKMIAWLTALVMLIGGILIRGGSVTEAASKKLSVSSEKSVAVNCNQKDKKKR